MIMACVMLKIATGMGVCELTMYVEKSLWEDREEKGRREVASFDALMVSGATSCQDTNTFFVSWRLCN